MLRDALLSVSSEEKELVGQTIADLVRLSNQNGLKTSVVTITGPIIRILGDRYAPSIRAVMLDALNVLIEKVRPSNLVLYVVGHSPCCAFSAEFSSSLSSLRSRRQSPVRYLIQRGP